jgi:DNA-binding Lrp family transcriptional regulator
MKKIERKLLSELMKNSSRSDRELAKAIGSSQPTVSRTRKRLEEQGYIKEYTMIPDFGKLGFEIMAFTFLRYKKELTPEEFEEIKKIAEEYELMFPMTFLMVLKGMGLGYDRIIVTFHEDYSGYTEMLSRLRQFPLEVVTDVQSFLVNLKGTEHYQPFTLSKIAKYLLTKK